MSGDYPDPNRWPRPRRGIWRRRRPSCPRTPSTASFLQAAGAGEGGRNFLPTAPTACPIRPIPAPIAGHGWRWMSTSDAGGTGARPWRFGQILGSRGGTDRWRRFGEDGMSCGGGADRLRRFGGGGGELRRRG